MRSKDQILLEKIYTNLKENEQMEFPNMKIPVNPLAKETQDNVKDSGGIAEPHKSPVSEKQKGPHPQQIEKIKNLITQKGTFKTARILLNYILTNEIQLGLNDLSDDTTISSVVEDIESYLEDGDIEGAWHTAKDSVEEIMSNQF